jgi:hypothetical protein
MSIATSMNQEGGAMWDTEDVVHAWHRAGNPTPHQRLGLGPFGGAR